MLCALGTGQFNIGVFPEHTQFDYRYPQPAETKPITKLEGPRGIQEYEEEGKEYYKLAAQHEAASAFGLSEVLQLLHENFNVAKKPLNFLSQYYFARQKQQLFGDGN